MANEEMKFNSCYLIPAHGVMPSEEMIEWLHENPLDWDGDDGGITLEVAGKEDHELGSPGEDYVVRFEDGSYRIVKAADFDNLLQNAVVGS